MHVALLTYGSRGDVEPFVALGKGLLRTGHGVRLVGPEAFGPLVKSHGIDFVGLPGDPQHLVQNLVDVAGRNPLRMVGVMSSFVLPLAASVLERVHAACEATDAIIHSFLLTQAGHEVARASGIPDISAQLFPVFSSTAEFPGVPFPDLPLGGVYRWLTHGITTQTFRQGGRILYWWVRRASPHLPPLSRWPFDRRNDRRPPILYAFSPCIIPPPADWSEDAHITGYWFLEGHGDWQPREELLGFLELGAPPVAISFGSTVTRDPNELAETVLKALALSRQRGVMVGAGLQREDLPSGVFVLDYAPYSWLFPRMSAVVHHGGAGTTGAGLMAGVPNIVIPFTSDQPFWGRRVHQLGAGPKPIPARSLSVKRLAEAIVEAVSDVDMRSRAWEIGKCIRAEDGVSRAIDLVERCAQATV